jgi:cytidylate kinase
MSAITISRQTGSRGDDLARQLAQHLGWRWVSRNLINEAALAAGAPQVALAEIDELGFFDLTPSTKEWQAYQSQVEHIIRELANEGNVVIVGRGGQVVLRDHPDILHLRIVAPLETRRTWLQEERNMSVPAALAWLEKSSQTRNRYLQRCYRVRVDDPTLYHLVINTGLIDMSQAVNLVIQTFRALVEKKEVKD